MSIIETMARAHHEEAQKWRIVGIPGSPWYAEREDGRLIYAQSREDAMDVSRHACMRAALRAAMERSQDIKQDLHDRDYGPGWVDNAVDDFCGVLETLLGDEFSSHADIAAMRAKLAEVERERDAFKEGIDNIVRGDKARADRLEAAIRKAPHDKHCASQKSLQGIGIIGFPCDCWKRDALEGT